MALRRGVDKTMIKVFEQYEKKDDMDKTKGVKTLLQIQSHSPAHVRMRLYHR
jgi:hypothetical protein